MRIAIVLNASWNIVNFRMGLMNALAKDGHEIIAIAPRDEYSGSIPFSYEELPMSPRGLNPFSDLALLFRIIRLYRRLRPGVLLHFTPKPNLYGSFAARALRIPVVSNIAGLGSIFTGSAPLRILVERMYKAALHKNALVFFQNEEDRSYFIRKGLIPSGVTGRIPGSGIDLARFRPVSSGTQDNHFRFLLVSRLLWEKGVGDYIEAVGILKRRGVNAIFQLLGFYDDSNPASVARRHIDDWKARGLIEYLGKSDDVRREIGNADCIVLPSTYREGVPRVLIESAAMAKPIIAYRNVGVGDIVEHGLNGILVESRNTKALADAMEQMILLSPESRMLMGVNGRCKVEREFDEAIVIDSYRQAIDRAARINSDSGRG